MSGNSGNEFEKQALRKSEPGLLREFWDFLWDSKKWWLLPIFLVIALFGPMMALSTTAVAPFIYTLF
jgi:hypothetical protein